MGEVKDLARRILGEMEKVVVNGDGAVSLLVHQIVQHRTTRIFLHGVGREGLMMKAFAMRLFHLGLSSHCIGDMTTPAISPGDLLFLSAGPGGFSTVNALAGVAKSAGARVLLVTAQPHGSACQFADAVALLPAQTMADDAPASQQAGDPATGSVLPMGSLYEGALYVTFEIVVLKLREALGVSPDNMRARHTNLE